MHLTGSPLVKDLEQKFSTTMAYSTTAALMVVAIGLTVVYMSRMLLFKQRKANLPPGPTPWPIIGSLHLLGTHPHNGLALLAQQYGPLMSLQLGQQFCVVASSALAAKEFLKLQDANFSFRTPLRAAELIVPKDLIFHTMTPVLRHLKKILVSELTCAKRLEASKHIRGEEIAAMLKAISQETGPIQVNTYLNIMSTNILSRTILNKRFLGGSEGGARKETSEIREFIEIIEEAAKCFTVIHLQDIFPCIPRWLDPQGLNARFRKLAARLTSFHRQMIKDHQEERRKNPASALEKNMLDVLLEQLDHPELQVTEEHIKGIIWDVLAAGTEAPMLACEWAMAEVLRNPTMVKEARLELERVVGINCVVQESDIPQLKYIQAIVKEALRLHPPVPCIHLHQNSIATKAFGFDIPANTRVFVNAWAIARDPAVWEKPLEFAPERFLEKAQYGSIHDFQGQHNFEFIPFGAGRRSCLGMAFGSIAMHLQVANLLHAFDWSFPNGLAPEKLDMTEGLGIVLGKLDPLVAVAKPRWPLHLY